jgi:hypothetical protein
MTDFDMTDLKNMFDFLNLCHREGIFDADHYQILVNKLFDNETNSVSDVLYELRLQSKYNAFMNGRNIDSQAQIIKTTVDERAQNAKEQTAKEEREKDRIQREQRDKVNLERETKRKIRLDEVKIELEKYKADYTNAKARYAKFEDNPRLKADFERIRAIYEPLEKEMHELNT